MIPRLVVCAALGLVACSGSPPTSTEPPPRPRREAREVDPLPEVAPLPPSTYPEAPRVVAIGDVHGDLGPFRNVLRLAGAIDPADHWIGGTLTVVQTGDLLDRGDDEDEILALVQRLEREATEAGGRFLALIGNHEVMNAEGDFRYVTPEGFTDFDRFAHDAHGGHRSAPRSARGRTAAFEPGGRYARELAARNTVVVVGDTVFLHGGLVASRLDGGIDAINRGVRAFFLGESALPLALAGEESPLWYRGYALEDDAASCARLDAALARVPARRMVIGHTVQEEGITSACGERVWRIDVGLADLYDGPIEALEITPTGTRVLRGTR